MLANNGSLRLSTTKMIGANHTRELPHSPVKTNRLPLCLGLTLVLVATAFYAWFLVANGVSRASASDASGYFNSARLLGQGEIGFHAQPITGFYTGDWDPYYQQPLGFALRPHTDFLVPTYPVGLPLQLLLAAKLVGWSHAAVLVNVLSALLAGLLTALIGRDFAGLEWKWSLAAAAFLWVCPLFVFFALQPMSDVPATLWTLLAFWTAAKSRHRLGWAAISGAAVGIAVLVRPTNALVLLPVAVLLGLDWRRWLALAIGGLPFAVCQAVYNLKIYERIFVSGYGDVSSLLSSRNVADSLANFAQWIPQLAGLVVVLALGLPWFWRSHTRFMSALIVWLIALIGFYSFYSYSSETWWYLRFILPAFPFLILAAFMVAQRLARFLPTSFGRGAVLALLLVLSVPQQVVLNRNLNVTGVHDGDQAYFQATEWLRQHAPADSLIVAMQTSGAVHFYTDFILIRYDLADPSVFERFCDAARTAQRPIFAPLSPPEIERVVGANLGGQWKKVATIDHITIWRLQT